MKLTTVLVLWLALVSSLAQGSFFDDFNDGNANGWDSDQGTWGVVDFAYHGTGRYFNSRVWNISYVPAFGGTNLSVAADMHTDPGFDDVSKMLILRYSDPENFLVVNFRAGSRADVVVEQMVNGARSYLVPEFAHRIPEHGQTEWHHCRADVDGTRIIAYFDGREVLNKNVSAILARPGAVGLACFSSPGGGDEEVFADNYAASLFDFVSPASVSLDRGRRTSGGLPELLESDNAYYTVEPFVVLSSAEAPVQIIVEGPATFAHIGELRFKLEAAVSVINLTQSIDLYNFDANVWEQVDTRAAPLSDLQAEVVITVDASRFVRPGANGVRSRIRVKERGPVFKYPWTVRVDRVMWTMNHS